jgi:hypothetical protein
MPNKVRDLKAARLRRRVRTGKIVLAPQTEIDAFATELVDGFLDRIFQVSGALVTDETRLSDFVSFGSDPQESVDAVAKVCAEYGVNVDIHDRLVEVLRRIG